MEKKTFSSQQALTEFLNLLYIQELSIQQLVLKTKMQKIKLPFEKAKDNQNGNDSQIDLPPGVVIRFNPLDMSEKKLSLRIPFPPKEIVHQRPMQRLKFHVPGDLNCMIQLIRCGTYMIVDLMPMPLFGWLRQVRVGLKFGSHKS